MVPVYPCREVYSVFPNYTPKGSPPSANAVTAASAPFPKEKIFTHQKFTLSFSLSLLTFRNTA